LHFALADSESDFDFALLPIKREREKRISLYGGESEQFADLRFMQQKLSFGFRFVILKVAVGVFVNVRVVKKDFVILNARECIADLAFAGAQGFDLSAMENDARLERLEDVIVAAGFRIAQNVGHEVKFEIRNAKFETTSKIELRTM